MKRYYWILMTYVTRPAVWVVALACLGLVGSAIYTRSDRHSRVTPQILSSDLPIIKSRAELDQFAEMEDSVQVLLGRVVSEKEKKLVDAKRSFDGEAVHITSDELLAVARDAKQGLRFPKNVEALTTGGYGQEFLTEISKIESLKRLEFSFSHFRRTLDISQLASLKKLEVLDLGMLYDVGSLKPLMELPNLHTLRIHHNGVITKDQMAVVASLPALSSLYLSDVSKSDWALDAVTELKSSESLKNIFVDIPLSEPAMVAKVQSRLPNINVRSSQYRAYRLFAFVCMLVVSIIATLLSTHINAPFSMPQSELIPGYRRRNLLMTWLIMTSVILSSSWFVAISTGAHFFPIVSAFGLAMTVMVNGNTHRVMWQKLTPTFYVLRLTIIIATFASMIFLFKNPMLVEEFLMGKWPWVAMSFIALGLLFAGQASWRLHGQCRSRYAAGAPLALSIPQFQKAVAEIKMRGKEDAKGQINPQTKLEFGIRALGLLVVGLVIAKIAWGDQLFGSGVAGAMMKGQVVAYGIAFGFLIMGLIGAKWWQRMPYLATMITRPPNRREQVNSLLKDIRNDFLFLLPPMFVAVVMLGTYAPFWSTVNLFPRAFATGLFAISVALACYAAVVWALIIRTMVGLIVLGVALQFALSFLVILSTISGVDFQQGIPPYRVAITAVTVSGLAIPAILFARKKYTTFEWGKLL